LKVYIFFVLLLIAGAPKSIAGENPVDTLVYRAQMYFTENAGQWDKDIRYAMLRPSTSAWLCTDGVILARPRMSVDAPGELPRRTGKGRPMETLSMNFVNPSPAMRIFALDTSKAVSHFYLNPDSTGWYEHVRNHRVVRYENVWDGIDIEYREGEAGDLKQIVRLGAGADVSNIAFELCGAGRNEVAEMLMNTMQTNQTGGIENTGIHIRSDANGEALRVVVGPGFTYKDTLNLTTEFNTALRFSDDGNYSHVLQHTVSQSGHVSLLGVTESPSLPVRNAVQDHRVDYSDWFIIRFDSTGHDYTFCTYIGGTDAEGMVNGGTGWVTNGDGHVPGFRNWILHSDDFGNTYACLNASEGAPVRANSWKPSPPQSILFNSAYVFSLTPAGALRGSTYLGGPGEFMPVELNVTDSAVYVLGGNHLRGVATSSNALMKNKECDSCFAVILTSLSTDLSREIYTTYLLSGSRASFSHRDADYITPKFIVDDNGTALVALGLGADRKFLLNPEYRVPGLGRDAFFGLWLAGLSRDGARLEYSSFIPFSSIPHGSIESFRHTSLHRNPDETIVISGATYCAQTAPVDTIPVGWRSMELLSERLGSVAWGNWIMKLGEHGEFLHGLYYGTSGRWANQAPLYRNSTCPGYLMFRTRCLVDGSDTRLVDPGSLNKGELNYFDRYILDFDEDLNVRYTSHWNAYYLPFQVDGEAFHIDAHGYAYMSTYGYHPGNIQEGPDGPYQFPRFHNSWRVPKDVPPDYPSGVDPTKYHDSYLVRFRMYTPCWQVGCGIASIDTLRIDREERYAEPREFDVDFAVTNHSPEKGARVLHALIEVPPGCALSRGLPSQPMIPATLSSGQTAHCSWTLRVTNPALVQDTIVVRCRVFYIDPESGQTYPPGEELCEHDIHVVKSSGYDPRLRCMVEGPDSLHWTGAGYAARAGDAPGAIRYTITYTNISTDTVAVARFEQTAGDHCLIVANASRQGGRIAPGEVVSFPVDVRVNSLRYNRAITVRTVALDDYDMPWTACEKSSVAPGIPHLPCDANGPVSITWNVATGTSTPPEPEFNLELSNPLDTIRMGLHAWLDLASASHLSALAGDSLFRGPVFINPAFRRTLSWKLRVNPPPSADTRDTLYFRYDCDGLEQYCMLVLEIIVIDQTVLCSIAAPQALTEHQVENHENVQLDYTLSNVGSVPVTVDRVDLAITSGAGVLAIDPLSQPGGSLAPSGNINRQWRLRPLVLRQSRTAHFDVTAYGVADSVLSVCSHDMHIPGIDGLLCDITAVDTVRFIRDELRYDPDPVPVTMDLRNILDTPETSIEAEIDLAAAPRFELASGENAIKTLSSLDSNSAAQLQWLLRPLPGSATEAQHITIRYRSLEQTGWKECSASVIIAAWPHVKTTHCVVSGHDSLHADQAYERIIPEPFEISYSATNTGTVALHNCSATIVLPPEFELVSDSATLSFGSLRPGDSNTRWWTLKTTSALAGYGPYPVNFTWYSDEQGSSTGCDHTVHVLKDASSGIVFTPLHLHFEAKQNDPLPAAQHVQLWTGGGLSMPWTAQGGQWWLNADPVSGDHAARIAVQPNSTALPVGLHATKLRIAGQAPNLPKDVAVTYESPASLAWGPSNSITTYGLGPVWPQPVPLNGEARISINLPAGVYVRIVLYDALGRELAVVKEGVMPEADPVLRIAPAVLRMRPGMYFIRMIGAGGRQHGRWWCGRDARRASVRAVVVR
jgi:hypothetical protein